MRSSFFVLQPLFARKHRVKPGKKPPLCIRVHRKAPSWTGSSRSASLVASHGNISLRCIPEGASDRKTPSRGKILPPCIQNELVLARYVLHVFKMPCKAPFGNTSRGYLAIKTPFSRPNPSNHAQWANIATLLQFYLLCEVRRATSAVARPLCGGASVAVRPLRGGVSAVICPFRGDASTATKKRVQPKVPSWVRSSRNAFLSGKSWRYFVAMHPEGAL